MRHSCWRHSCCYDNCHTQTLGSSGRLSLLAQTFNVGLVRPVRGASSVMKTIAMLGGDKGLAAGWMMEAVGSVVNPLMPLNHVRVPVCLLRDEFIVKAKPYFSASTTTPGRATGTPSTTLPPWTLQTSCRDSSRMRQCMSQCERGSAGTVGGHSHY